MRTVRIIAAYIFGILLVIGGINHFINPEFYNKLIPVYLPSLPVNYITGVVELVLGIGVMIPAYRSRAGFGITVLMCFFLPIHVWDVTRNDPAMGSQTAAMIRLSLQFVLILWGWYISKKDENLNS